MTKYKTTFLFLFFSSLLLAARVTANPTPRAQLGFKVVVDEWYWTGGYDLFDEDAVFVVDVDAHSLTDSACRGWNTGYFYNSGTWYSTVTVFDKSMYMQDGYDATSAQPRVTIKLTSWESNDGVSGGNACTYNADDQGKYVKSIVETMPSVALATTRDFKVQDSEGRYVSGTLYYTVSNTQNRLTKYVVDNGESLRVWTSVSTFTFRELVVNGGAYLVFNTTSSGDVVRYRARTLDVKAGAYIDLRAYKFTLSHALEGGTTVPFLEHKIGNGLSASALFLAELPATLNTQYELSEPVVSSANVDGYTVYSLNVQITPRQQTLPPVTTVTTPPATTTSAGTTVSGGTPSATTTTAGVVEVTQTTLPPMTDAAGNVITTTSEEAVFSGFTNSVPASTNGNGDTVTATADMMVSEPNADFFASPTNIAAVAGGGAACCLILIVALVCVMRSRGSRRGVRRDSSVVTRRTRTLSGSGEGLREMQQAQAYHAFDMPRRSSRASRTPGARRRTGTASMPRNGSGFFAANGPPPAPPPGGPPREGAQQPYMALPQNLA